ncbi:hypothetical protein DFH09DRAFT_1121924, partial [Mycena vulgaris]
MTPTAKANDFYDPTAHANDLDGESQRPHGRFTRQMAFDWTPSLRPYTPFCSCAPSKLVSCPPFNPAPVQPHVPSTLHRPPSIQTRVPSRPASPSRTFFFEPRHDADAFVPTVESSGTWLSSRTPSLVYPRPRPLSGTSSCSPRAPSRRLTIQSLSLSPFLF